MAVVTARAEPKLARRSAIIPAGIACGASIWGIYGILEYVFYTIPRVSSENSILTHEFWAINAMLVASYLVVGALIGCVLALLVRAAAPHKAAILGFLAAATLTVSQIAHFLVLSRKITLTVALLLVWLLGQILGVFYAPRFSVLQLFAGALPLSLILLSRKIGELLSTNHADLARAGLIFLVILAGAIWYRRRPFATGGNFKPLLAACTLIALIGTSALATVIAAPPAPRAPVMAQSAGNAGPNVILLVMDTVRADHLSLYGYSRPTAPNLQKLAAGATLYTHCFAVSDMTLATHATLFTGLYPKWHGAHYAPAVLPHGRPLPDEIWTLVELLQKGGYATLGVAANHWYLTPEWGLSQGFDYYDSRFPVPAIEKREQFSQSFRRALSYIWDTASLDRDTRTAADLDREALRLIGSAVKAKRPFFLFLNYMETHTPYLPGAAFRDRYGSRNRHFTNFEMQDLTRAVRARRRLPTAHERDHLISQYDAGLTQLDERIGQFIQQLKDRGIYDNSLIIVTSDHGEAFGERYRLEHSSSVYQDQIGVPLIVKYPHSGEKRVIDTNVSQIDIFPTILSATSLPPVSGVQGTDLREIATAGNRTLFSTSFEPFFSTVAPTMKRTEYAVISGSHKLVVSTRGQTQLFDLAADPNEQSDISAAQPATVQELRKILADHIRSAPKLKTTQTTVSSKDLQRLKSLGYVQ
jgi:arylsulfatase A-like enzyme